MSLILKDVYEDTKRIYGLELLAGSKGLSGIMNWVYLAEDATASDFLSPGQLVITTGVSRPHSSAWLSELIQMLIQAHTCGLIINVGNYITEEDITKEIRQLCEDSDYPLFIMPWKTHIADITHDYYNRIFADNQTEQTLTNAFLNLVRTPFDTSYSVSVLEEYGYSAHQPYGILYLQADGWNTNTVRNISRTAKAAHPQCHICITKQYLAIIIPRPDTAELCGIAEKLLHTYTLHAPNSSLYIGISNTCNGFDAFARSFYYAKSAACISHYRQQAICNFDNLGFYKILLSVSDRTLLKDYVRQMLGPVFDYDEQHHSSYTDTLYQYLLCDGSILRIADALYCHRNTVNYRVKLLKETLHYQLDDTQTRCELLIAYQIQEFLTLNL